MTQAAMDQIVCASCSKGYRWKPELSGKKGKCKCGQLLQFPVDDPGAQATAVMPRKEEVGEYEINEPVAAPKAVAPKPAVGIKACKGCSGMLAPGAVLCMRCGLNQTTGKKLSTSVGKEKLGATHPVTESMESGGKWWLEWLYLVGAVAAVGIIMGIWMASSPKSGTEYSGYVAIGGLVIWAIGTIWGIRTATQDNFLLRMACRIIPFVGWYMIIKQSIREWGEMKTPVMILAFGFGTTTAAGICWFVGSVMMGVAHAGG